MKRKVVIVVICVLLVSTLAFATTQRVRAGLLRCCGVYVEKYCVFHGYQNKSGRDPATGCRYYPAAVYVKKWVMCRTGNLIDAIAWAEAGVAYYSTSPFVHTYTHTRMQPPAMWANASGWAVDPSGTTNNTIFLDKGITLMQNGFAKARYEITMFDMNTTTVYTYWAQLENGTFTASPNWIGNWTLPALGSNLKVMRLPPINITIEAMPGNHVGNCTNQAMSKGYTKGSIAIANSTEEPEAPVGGVWVPVDKLALLAPYIALASTILVATAATAIHVKRRKKKQ